MILKLETRPTPNFKVKNDAELGVFVKCSNMIDGFENRYEAFDIMTFTCNPCVLGGNVIERLIIGHKDHTHIDAEMIRYCPSLHTKLYICYKQFPKVYDVFVGSLNLNTSTMVELLVRVNKKQGKFLLNYFNIVWETLGKEYGRTKEKESY